MGTLSMCKEEMNSDENFDETESFKGDGKPKRGKKKSGKKMRKKGPFLNSAENDEMLGGDDHSVHEKYGLSETIVHSLIDKFDDSLQDSLFRKQSGNTDPLMTHNFSEKVPKPLTDEICMHNTSTDTASFKKRKHKKGKQRMEDKSFSSEVGECDKMEHLESSTENPLKLLSTSAQLLETNVNDNVSGQSESQICISTPSTVSPPPKKRGLKKRNQALEHKNLLSGAGEYDKREHLKSSKENLSRTSAQPLVPMVDDNVSGLQENEIGMQLTVSVSPRKKRKKRNQSMLEHTKLSLESAECDKIKHLLSSKENTASASPQSLEPTVDDNLSTLPGNKICIDNTASKASGSRKKRRKKRNQALDHKNLSSDASEFDTIQNLKSTKEDPSKKLTSSVVPTVDDNVFPKSLGEVHTPERSDFSKDTNQRDHKKQITMIHSASSLDCVSVLTHKESRQLEGLVDAQVQQPLETSPGRKLLVLDVNGLLVEVCGLFDRRRSVCTRIGRKLVFKRPFCEEFLDFCFERFDVGIWSSLMMRNLKPVVDFLLGNMKSKLLFCLDGSFCTKTGLYTIGDKYKPLVLKELKKIWGQEWDGRWYTPSGTLLVDDSPYKALLNPPHTAIFPQPFVLDDENDNALGQGGTIRAYLEGLAMAADVQEYVKSNPFGQPAISVGHPDWDFYKKVIEPN